MNLYDSNKRLVSGILLTLTSLAFFDSSYAEGKPYDDSHVEISEKLTPLLTNPKVNKGNEVPPRFHISEQFYKDLGLEWIVQYSNPITDPKVNPKGAKYLYLGPVKSKQKRCVMLLRLVDVEKACSKATCMPVFQFYDEQELKYEGKEMRLMPYQGQFVLLSTPCNNPTQEKPVILFSNHPKDDAPRPYGYQCHVMAFSVERYNQHADKDPKGVGGWYQKDSKNKHIIEFRTEASEGMLEWSPSKGYSWSETEP